MTSERKRIISNYVRLFVTFFAGILIVRLIAEIAVSALVLYLLIFASSGFAQAFKIIVQESAVPALGLSYNHIDGKKFGGIYWFSFVLSFAASLCALLVYGVFWALRGYMDFGGLPTNLYLIALIAAALRTVVSSLANPSLNAILVSGRVVTYNVVLVCERLSDLVGILIVHLLLSGLDAVDQIIWFYGMSTLLYVLTQLTCYLAAVKIDKRFCLRPAALPVKERQWVKGLFGWNVVIVVAFLLYLRLSTFLLNISYGEESTLIVGIVFLLIGYQRQISMGLVVGLDAVASRLNVSSHRGDAQMRELILRSTYIQAVFSLGSMVFMILFVEQIFNLWFGDSLLESGWNVEQAGTIFRVMAIGVLARSLSEAWMKLLGGRGMVGSYAGYLILAAVVNALVVFGIVNFGGYSVYVTMVIIAISFSIFYVLVHLFVVPLQVERYLGVKFRDLIYALLMPVQVMLIAGVIGWGVVSQLDLAYDMFITTVFLIAIGLWLVVRGAKYSTESVR